MGKSAIDYLLDYTKLKNEDKWLQKIVSCYLHFNGKISDSEIQKIVNKIIKNQTINYSLDSLNKASSSSKTIKLNKLNHQSGISALADNQEIVFNDQVTLLYGLNGSGKSSYFRIIQAMLGSIKNTDIVQNIYFDEHKNINVNLQYSIDNTTKDINWNNDKKIEDLSSIKVFDSNYSKKFLEKRESDEQVLYPYKLFVFSEIAEYVDKVKKIANEKLDLRTNNNKSPKLDDFLEGEKKRFEGKMTYKDKEHFTSIADSFDEDKENELLKINIAIKELTETNYSDKIKILDNKKSNFKNVKNRVKNELFNWINISEEYKNLINLHKKYKIKSEKNKDNIEILSNLPGTESDEWKKFIKAGLSISESSQALNNSCPYCHREYDEEALSIVEAYSEFIKDETEKELKEIKSEIRKIIDKASNSNIKKEDYLIENEENLQYEVFELFDLVIKYLDALKKAENSFKAIDSIKYDTEKLMSKFKTCEENYDCKIKKLQNESNKKDEKINKLKEEKKKLLSQKSIYQQKNIIVNFINESICIREAKERIDLISSHKISTISKKAHKELLSNQLVDDFNKFLKELSIKQHKIELKNTTNKGSQQTELVLKSKNNIKKILSEGEQKAVSIALFLAEISVAKNKSTIILDDPINSLDHRIINCLSDILLQLDNQLIIFTHNRMFLDSISGSDFGHMCKNFNYNGCNKRKGKHIFVYKVQAEGMNEKGVITQKNRDDAEGYLDRAKELLKQSPFNEGEKVCVLLRNAIDHIIDEIVFNNQIPRRYSMKGVQQSINWKELKNMASDKNTIDELRDIFGRVSSGELHYGQDSSDNPPDKEELIILYDRLVNIMS